MPIADPTFPPRRSRKVWCAELGQDVHAAGGRTELSGDLRRRGSVSRGARVCAVRFRVRDVLNGSGDKYLPAATLGLGGGETDQLALSITGGYRARFPIFAQDNAEAGRNGMYVAANYHYLHGLRFDDFNAQLQLKTDSAGLVSPTPQAPPFMLEWQTSSTGRGMALDFGVTFVRNRWDFGAGVSGVANRINWSKIRRHEVALVSLLNGNEFLHVKLPLIGVTSRLVLPVTYTGDVAYHREKWSVFSEYSRGFQGNNFLTGLEYRLGEVELRGAGRVSQGNWYPSGGAGFNLTRNFGIDAAALRHPHVPRDESPCRAGHLPSLRQEVAAHVPTSSLRRLITMQLAREPRPGQPPVAHHGLR